MATPVPAAEPLPAPTLDRGVLRGLVAFRWLALGWVAVVLTVTRHSLGRPVAATVAVAVVAGFTATVTILLRGNRPPASAAPLALVEVALGFGLLVADGWVYSEPHTQSLGSAWPLAGAMVCGVLFGPWGGAAAGVILGLGRVVGARLAPWADPSALSLLSTGVLFALAGGVAGFLMRRLREAENEAAAARAREDIARTLHDGVLQTLAVVQRRSTDTELAALARDQERELRQYLFGVTAPGAGLMSALRDVAARFEHVHGGRVDVIAVDDAAGDLDALAQPVVAAVGGAVGEALTNAAKHGHARKVVIYVEPGDDELFVSVKDDGTGFEPTSADEGVGMSRSIRGRMHDVGGRVEVESRPGRGAEVRLWAPR